MTLRPGLPENIARWISGLQFPQIWHARKLDFASISGREETSQNPQTKLIFKKYRACIHQGSAGWRADFRTGNSYPPPASSRWAFFEICHMIFSFFPSRQFFLLQEHRVTDERTRTRLGGGDGLSWGFLFPCGRCRLPVIHLTTRPRSPTCMYTSAHGRACTLPINKTAKFMRIICAYNEKQLQVQYRPSSAPSHD